MSKPGFQLLALSPPPWTEHLPALPSPPRAPAFSKGLLDAYSLSTHIFPAAYPRTTPPVPVPSVPSSDLPFKERKAGLNKAVAETLALRADYEADKLPQDGDARPLWICVNRYTRRKSKTTGKGITLVLSHSNGFMKESWEPVLDKLLSITSIIHEIWCLDAVQHGDSALLNQGKIGGLFDWRDQGRDILQLLVWYLPDKISQAAPPLHLLRADESTALRRKEHGFGNRTIVGAGHSLGAFGTLFAAITHPALFNSIISVEGVSIPPDPAVHLPGLRRVVAPTISRRSVWDSRDAARADLATSAFFRYFNPAQVDVYIETALYVRPDGRVGLKQDPVHEASVFEVRCATIAWDHVGELYQGVDVHWIRSSKPGFFNPSMAAGDEFICRSKDSRIGGRGVSSGVVDGHHLVVQENPEGVAQEMWRFVHKKYREHTARL